MVRCSSSQASSWRLAGRCTTETKLKQMSLALKRSQNLTSLGWIFRFSSCFLGFTRNKDTIRSPSSLQVAWRFSFVPRLSNGRKVKAQIWDTAGQERPGRRAVVTKEAEILLETSPIGACLYREYIYIYRERPLTSGWISKKTQQGYTTDWWHPLSTLTVC